MGHQTADETCVRYWNEILPHLEKKISEVVFTNAIKPLKPYKIVDDTFFIIADTYFNRNTVNTRYYNELLRILHIVSERPELKIKIVTEAELNNPNGKSELEKIANKLNLNTKYVFESFVKGRSNELAYAAAHAVAEAWPNQTSYNPLFLYGGVGLGKTHLMSAIGNYILAKDKNAKIVFSTAETFLNELITSIRENSNIDFRNKYREIDVLLLDDVQFLTAKERTQEEFFHTFNALYGANKQIVLTSDQPPNRLTILEERLRSRFGSGLTVDITLPDFETRTAILEKKAQQEGIVIPSDVTQFIARNVVSNIRELEGVLIKVIAYATLTKAPINMEVAELSIAGLKNEQNKREITTELVQEVVAKHYNLTIDDMKSKKRTQHIAYPRQIAMYLSRKLLEISLPQVGALFGGRDHSTVIYACEKIMNESETDTELRNTLLILENKIKGDS